MISVKKEPFRFYTRQNIIYLLGIKAKNLEELINGIKEVPTMSIYHHTHHYLEMHEYLSPEPPNDFAYWITNILLDKIIGEEVASIDLRQFATIEEMRFRLIEVIESYLQANDKMVLRYAPRGQEFHFMSARTFVFPTKHTAVDLKQFLKYLKKVSLQSIYYHVFEAGLEKKIPDFATWLSLPLNEMELAREFRSLDPYTQTLENLRQTLIKLVENRMKEIEHGNS
jgi:hypothetical protein